MDPKNNVKIAQHADGSFRILDDSFKPVFESICKGRGAKTVPGERFQVEPQHADSLAYKLTCNGFQVERWRWIDRKGFCEYAADVSTFLEAIEDVCHQHRLVFVAHGNQLKIDEITRERMDRQRYAADGRGGKLYPFLDGQPKEQIEQAIERRERDARAAYQATATGRRNMETGEAPTFEDLRAMKAWAEAEEQSVHALVELAEALKKENAQLRGEVKP